MVKRGKKDAYRGYPRQYGASPHVSFKVHLGGELLVLVLYRGMRWEVN